MLKFNSHDRGYYWCQMVVSNVSLSPSPYGYIRSRCIRADTICSPNQLICGHNLSGLRFMAHAQGNGSCIHQEFHAIITNKSASRNTESTDKSIILATMSPTVSMQGKSEL